MGKVELDVRSKTVDATASHLDLSLPSAPTVAPKDQTVDINKEQNRIQKVLIEMLEAGSNEVVPAAAIYVHKLNYLQAELRSLRELVEAQKDMGLETWQGLEKAIAKVESEVTKELKGLNQETLTSASASFSEQIDLGLQELQVARDRFNAPRNVAGDWQKTFDRDSILKELGVSFGSEREAQEKRVQLAVEREQLADSMHGLQEKITAAEKLLKERFAALNKATGERDYSLMDVISFSGSYEAENESDRLQIKSLRMAAQDLAKLEQQMAGLSQRAQVIDVTLTVFSVEQNHQEGRHALADRQMLRLLETGTEAVARSVPLIEQSALKASEQLEQHGMLTERDKLIVLSTDSARAAASSVEHKSNLIEDTAVAIDVMDQVHTRETFKITMQKPASQVFAATPEYQGRKQAHMNGMTYTVVDFRGGDRDGESYHLLFTKTAQAAWDDIPKGAQPVFLRPIATLTAKTESLGRGGARVTLTREPSAGVDPF